jgi:hypothetical protein
VKRYNGPADDYDQAYSICIDTLGNCYVTGASVGTGTGDDYTTIKYDPIGVQQWVVRYNGPANGGDGAGSVLIGNDNTVYVGGESDGIGTGKDLVVVKYDQLIGIMNSTNEIPIDYVLKQNYPNPFNPTTKIKFSMPKKSFVQVRVYDILGRQKEMLVSEELNPAVYEVTFDAANYSSGVYLYQLIIDGNIFDSKKMVIVK